MGSASIWREVMCVNTFSACFHRSSSHSALNAFVNSGTGWKGRHIMLKLHIIVCMFRDNQKWLIMCSSSHDIYDSTGRHQRANRNHSDSRCKPFYLWPIHMLYTQCCKLKTKQNIITNTFTRYLYTIILKQRTVMNISINLLLTMSQLCCTIHY